MMGIFDSIKGLLGGVTEKLPENLNSVDELKTRAQELAEQHGDTINSVVDGIQEKLPESVQGTIDGAQDKLTQLGGGADEKQ